MLFNVALLAVAVWAFWTAANEQSVTAAAGGFAALIWLAVRVVARLFSDVRKR